MRAWSGDVHYLYGVAPSEITTVASVGLLQGPPVFGQSRPQGAAETSARPPLLRRTTSLGALDLVDSGEETDDDGTAPLDQLQHFTQTRSPLLRRSTSFDAMDSRAARLLQSAGGVATGRCDAAASSALPAGWKEVRDSASNTYYFNTITNI